MNSMVIFRTPVVSVVTTHAAPCSPPRKAPRIDPVLTPLASCYCWVGESIVLRILTSWSWLKTCCPPVFSVSIWGSPSFAFSKAYCQVFFFPRYLASTFGACFVVPVKSCSPGGRRKGTLPASLSSGPELPVSPDSNFSGIISFHAPRFTLWGILDGSQAGKLHFAEISLIPKALPPIGNYNTKSRTFSAFVVKKEGKNPQHSPPFDLSFQTVLGSVLKLPGGVL